MTGICPNTGEWCFKLNRADEIIEGFKAATGSINGADLSSSDVDPDVLRARARNEYVQIGLQRISLGDIIAKDGCNDACALIELDIDEELSL